MTQSEKFAAVVAVLAVAAVGGVLLAGCSSDDSATGATNVELDPSAASYEPSNDETFDTSPITVPRLADIESADAVRYEESARDAAIAIDTLAATDLSAASSVHDWCIEAVDPIGSYAEVVATIDWPEQLPPELTSELIAATGDLAKRVSDCADADASEPVSTSSVPDDSIDPSAPPSPAPLDIVGIQDVLTRIAGSAPVVRGHLGLPATDRF